MTVTLVRVLVGLLVLTVFSRADDKAESAPLTSEEYAAYSTLVRDFYVPESERIGGERLPGSKVVILGGTIGAPEYTVLDRLLPELGPIHRSTVAHFRIGATDVDLERRLDAGIDYQLVSTSDIENMFADHDRGWSRFKARFPGSFGYFAVSRIAFNTHGTEALVYVSYLCGNACGKGLLIKLARSATGWTIASSAMAWIS